MDNTREKEDKKMLERLKKLTNKHELGVATLMLAISAFCTFICMDIGVMLFKHGTDNISHILFVGVLTAINVWAVYLNVKRLSQVIQKRIEK